MAEALLFEAASPIVSEVVKRVMVGFRYPWDTKKDLVKLEGKLALLQAFLHDAGSRKYADNGAAVVNLWLKRVMDVAYYVEDVLDEYEYEELRKKAEVRSKFKLKGSFKRPFTIRVAEKVKKAKALLEAMYKEAHDLGIKPIKLTKNDWIPSTSPFEEYRQEREMASYTSGFVGRERDESKVVELMLSNPTPQRFISVVAIVAMGGIGKTTLGRRVYDSEVVRKHFHKRVWICVSRSFSIKRLLNEMVESLTTSKHDMSNVEASERVLQKDLEGQRYLLVLDDVWNTDYGQWESLLSSLYRIGGSVGTTILVTTRSHEVVATMQAQAIHELKKLTKEESWALFEQIVFRDEASCETSDLVAIGKRIVEKCKGVPLAIKMLGGLLRSKKDAWAWKSIERSEIWELPQNRFGILPSLLLSFYHLPSPVKQCFSYCAIFAKDAIISKNDLIRLWLAQGFLHHEPRRRKSAEDVGEEYFNILLSNSFLILLEGERHDLGVDMLCMMHDLVHDMAMFISRTESLIWKEENVMDDAFMVRHLALLGDNLEAECKFFGDKKLSKLSKLRTLYIKHSQLPIDWCLEFSIGIANNLLASASNLRVLKLSGIYWMEIPKVIGHLKLCRYLDLSGNGIKSLPDSITELYNLQTLKLEECNSLDKFPKGMSKLVNLRHLQTDRFVEMPVGMKSLTHLQTLPFLSLHPTEGGTIDEIGCLCDIRGVLYIQGLEWVTSKEVAAKAGLGKKEAIFTLGLRWSAAKDHKRRLMSGWLGGGIKRQKSGSTDEDVLDGLRPHPNLKRLEVVDYRGKKFPRWMRRMTVVDEMGKKASLNNLVDLFLTNCKKCKKLPTLGQLMCLRHLRIERMENVSHIGIEFYVYREDGSSSSNGENANKCRGRNVSYFPALRTLSLHNFPILTEWLPPPKGTRAPFSCLEDLTVLDCPCLITTPTQFPSLKRLSLSRIKSSQPLGIMITNIKNLRSVHLLDLPHVIGFPEKLGDCRELKELEIKRCDRLVGLANTPHNLVSLKKLCLDGCPSLSSLPSIDGLESLYRLMIRGCNRLSSIPSRLGVCTSLTILQISGCDNVESIPNMCQLTKLEELEVLNCKKLTSLPAGLECLHRLRTLRIGGLRDELENFPDVGQLADLESLTRLHLVGWPNLTSLPDTLRLLTAFSGVLLIKEFSFTHMPEWIGNLSSLDTLSLFFCHNLKHLPSRTTMLQLRRLMHINIGGCPHMIESCAKGVGPEWPKISHIPDVRIYP